MQIMWICIWAAVAIVMLIVEFATVGLVSVWFALGAFAAFVTAMITDSVWVQLLVFVIVSALSLGLTRPFLKKYLKPKKTATNADILIGKTCRIVKQVGPEDAVGRVVLGDVFWMAVSKDPADCFAEKEEAVIDSIQGNKLYLVKK